MARWTTRDIAISVDGWGSISISLLGEAEFLEQFRQPSLLRNEEAAHVLAVLIVGSPEIAVDGGGPFRRRRRLAQGIIPPGDLLRRHSLGTDEDAPSGELDVDPLLLPGGNAG